MNHIEQTAPGCECMLATDLSITRERSMEEQMIAEYAGTIPKVGDRVGIAQREGVFEAVDINTLMQTADLKSTDGEGHVTRHVAWTSLKFL